MLGIGKNMGIVLLTITVILSAATFLTTQNIAPSSPNDSSFVMGHVTLKVIDENGNIRDYRQSDNVIVGTGWDTLVQTAFPGDYSFGAIVTTATSSTPFGFIGVGTDGLVSPLGAGDPALSAEVCRSAFSEIFSAGAVVDPDPITGFSAITIEIAADFDGIGCPGFTLNEAGIFNDPAAGEMFARNTFGDVAPLGSDDTLELDWSLTFTGATIE